MRNFCVCVPARDEAERLPRLLAALAEQDVDRPIRVSLCVNNSTDDSMAVIADCQAEYRGRLDIRAEESIFPAELSHVGSARGRAMDRGAAWLDDMGAVLITTDADCRPPRGWITAILKALREEDLIIGGRIVIDPAEAMPKTVAVARALWDRYWEDVRAIEDALDPLPWDMAPRHGDHTGASLALTVGLYRAAGGVPLLASGEDRALVEAAILAGGKLVHPPSVWTQVSPRTIGRAPGGMAEAMAALHSLSASEQVPMAPAFDHWRARAIWRRAMRAQLGGDRRVILAERALPPMPCDMKLQAIR